MMLWPNTIERAERAEWALKIALKEHEQKEAARGKEQKEAAERKRAAERKWAACEQEEREAHKRELERNERG